MNKELIFQKLNIRKCGKRLYTDATGNEMFAKNTEEARILSFLDVIGRFTIPGFNSSREIRCPWCNQKHPFNSKIMQHHIEIIIDILISDNNHNHNNNLKFNEYKGDLIEEHRVMMEVCDNHTNNLR